jgi:hypothetical protein
MSEILIGVNHLATIVFTGFLAWFFTREWMERKRK